MTMFFGSVMVCTFKMALQFTLSSHLTSAVMSICLLQDAKAQ